MKKNTVYFILGLVTSISAHALSLSDAINKSQDNSLDIKQLKLESEATSWQKNKAWAEFLPKVSLDARHISDERFESVPFGGQDVVIPADYTSLGVSAEWNIFAGFKDVYEVSAANSETRAMSEKLKYAEQQNQVLIRTLYAKALGSQVLVEVADQNIAALEKHLADVSSRVRSGVSTRYDSLRVEVQLEDAKTEKATATSSVAVARAKLFEAIGIADDQLALSESLPENFLKVDLTQATVNTSSHADRESLLAETQAAQAHARSSQSHWYPKVSLFANYDWYNNYNHSITQDDEYFKSAYMIGFNLKWNLFDGGASYATQQQSALKSQISDLKLSKYDQNTSVSLEEAKSRFNSDVLNYKAKLSSVKKAEEAVRLAKGGVSAGILKNTDVLDAVVDLNRAKAAAIKSQVDAIEALGQLELILGKPLI